MTAQIEQTTSHNLDEANARQQHASNPLASVWVSANAGTGKTRVLTKRIVRLLLTDPTLMPHEILAMTYTKAAAQEMKSKVQESLTHLAKSSDEELLKILTDLDIPNPTKAAPRARNLFSLLSENAEGLNISTIHSFCQKFLRRFPLEAGISPTFGVMDDFQREALLKKAFSHIVLEEIDTHWHLNFLLQNKSDADLQTILNHFTAQAHNLADMIWSAGGAEAVLTNMAQHFGVPSTSTPADLTNALNTFFPTPEQVEFLQATIPQARAELATQKSAKTPEKILDKIQSALATGDQNAYLQAFLTQKLEPAATFASSCKKMPSLEQFLLAEGERLLAAVEHTLSLRGFLLSAAFFHLGDKMLAHYQKAKQETGLLDFEDLILKTHSLMKSPEENAWVLYKMDQKIKHILLDEGQDTNQHQWQIIKTLADEFNGQTQTSRTLFAVGDLKQSIYGFRGAQPEVFKTMENYIRTMPPASSLQAQAAQETTVNMLTSFRSAGVILDFVDKIFKEDAEKLGDNLVKHTPAHAHRGGAVYVWAPPEKAPAEKEEPADVPTLWELPPDPSQLSAPNAKESDHEENNDDNDAQKEGASLALLADKVAREIFRLGTSNLRLDCKNGAHINYGDIMILLNNRTHANLFIAALNRNNIPHTGLDRISITKQPMLMDLIHLLHFLAHRDDYSLALSLRSPLFNWAEENLMALRLQNPKAPLWPALQKAEPESATVRTLRHLLNYVDYEPVPNLVLRVLEATQARGKFMHRYNAGNTETGVTDQLLDLFLETLEPTEDLLTFLNKLETEQEIKQNLEATTEAVRLMTIHSAKGLQAPVVFVPTLTSGYRNKQREVDFWVEDDQGQKLFNILKVKSDLAPPLQKKLDAEADEKAEAEHLRLLYVAMTRAEEILYLMPDKKPSNATKCWFSHISAQLKSEWPDQTKPYAQQTPKFYEQVPQTREEKASEKPLPSLPTWATQQEPYAHKGAESVTGNRPHNFALQGKSQKFGQLVHKALEQIGEENPAPWPAATTEPEQQAQALAVQVKTTFPELFGPESAGEVSLAALVEGTLLHGVIDRLVLTPTEAWIIDYKTEAPPEKVPEIYVEQLAKYQKMAAHIFPAHTVKTALLWVGKTPTLQWIHGK